jgi:predicted molibdopterin-dependent oxidoreductase YjgC
MNDLKENRTAASGNDYRVNTEISRGAEIKIIVDGQPVKAFEGETVAAAILATGKRSLRITSKNHEPRGLYCAIGICFDCVMTIDNISNTRTCQTFVRNGMVIETQQGEGKWRIEP